MKLIVGLGNPGRKYEQTRHNIGYEVIRRLAQQAGAGTSRGRFDGELLDVQLPSGRALLLMPHTFMNLSGQSVRQAVDFYKLPTEDLLVVCDDFHLTFGNLRLRPSGSDGGQKGLADIIRRLGTNQFARLRVGIGPVPEQWNPADFVLSKFAGEEGKELDPLVARAAEAVGVWAAEGVDVAMNRFNAKES